MKLNKLFLAILAVFLFFANSAQAICPVCTIAVGAGIGLSRWLGIDDSVTGVWVGGLTVSLIMWTLDWLKRKNYSFKGEKIVVSLFYYLIIIVPLYFMGIMGHPLNTLWGFDKLIVGIVLGSLGFVASGLWYYDLKKKNDGHSYFPFQKVAMPVGSMVILSLIFYLITK